jgi:hypothetical protein
VLAHARELLFTAALHTAKFAAVSLAPELAAFVALNLSWWPSSR